MGAGPGHPLQAVAVVEAVQRAVGDHLGHRWRCLGFTDLDDRASHPAGVFHGERFSVFAKVSSAGHARAQFRAELDGAAMLTAAAGVRTAKPVGDGLVELEQGLLLITEAYPQRSGSQRTDRDWAAIGQALAAVHQVTGPRFGLDRDGYFGPLPLDNRPVDSTTWADFYLQRRLRPMLQHAVDSGHLPLTVAAQVEQVGARLQELSGPDHPPTLLHGDAQQNNFLSTPGGAVLVDPAPYFGHPEADLALLDYFEPVPRRVFDAYREIHRLDRGFEQRRELWRLAAYLAVVAVDGGNGFGRSFLTRVCGAVRRFT